LEQLERVPTPVELPLSRTPYFCSGCPHNSSVAVPAQSVVGGGIGCHGLAMVMDESQVGDLLGVTQMGGEGAQWIGIAPFVDAPRIFQNIGDGTFLHSGSLAVRAAVAAKIDITYKLLFNSAVAMTGGQQPAGGGLSVPEICALLEAEGVAKIIITTEDPARYAAAKLPGGVEVWDRGRLIEAQERLSSVSGVSVLIHDQECALEKRRKRKRGIIPDSPKRVFINERVCEGCGDCGSVSNCMSVVPTDTEFGRKTKIHQASCNKDYSCLEGDCPSFLEIVPAGRAASKQAAVGRLGELTDSSIPKPTPVVGARDFTMRITGIGGTGVVTVAQMLAIAAHLDGRHVRGLDQIGLAQKGGPVVSDIRISDVECEGANRLGTGDCDLYLGCDLLVAAEGKNLLSALPARTIAVVSTTEVATGRMVSDVNAAFPPPRSLTDRIASRVQADHSVFFSAQEEAAMLFGSDQTANVMLVGAAYQLGALPLSAAAIETAIRLNGTAVEVNVQAFRRGRQRISDPEGYMASLAATRPPAPARPTAGPRVRHLVERVDADPGSRLSALLEVRVADLVSYQNLEYAERYVRDVAAVLARERDQSPHSTALSEAVAFHLYKLMAYKDEAEVARLHLDPQFRRQIEAEFGVGARASWKLHPPLLRALGLKRKITLGPWFTPAYRVLYAMRRLRGTPFDPFGYARVRRVERQLIHEYRGIVRTLSANLTADNLTMAVEIAQLPDMIRGYEHIKLANVEKYRARVAELIPRFNAAV
jgi:indolepyruvate ferredoxin oxidoreductase